MADENRTPPHVLELLEDLQREPYSFDFYQAVRLLDCAHPDKPQTGHSRTPKDDPFRFAQDPSAAFAPATLKALVPGTETQPPRLVQRFFGMLGPQGPLPIHLTDYAQARIRHKKDHTFSRFLDLFHHRLLSLFYRAWARVRPTVNFDRGNRDRFGEYVESLFGLGMQSLVNRDSFPDLPKRHFAGLMSGQTKHAEGLLSILRGYFDLPVEIQQLVGQWIDLPKECRCMMGVSLSSSQLGKSVTVGSQVWDCQQKFRIVMGPLSLSDYSRLLPNNENAEGSSDAGKVSLDSLVALVRSYVGDDLQWDLQLILRKDETPNMSLGAEGQLGWSSWSFAGAMEEDPADLILDPLTECQQAELKRREESARSRQSKRAAKQSSPPAKGVMCGDL